MPECRIYYNCTSIDVEINEEIWLRINSSYRNNANNIGFYIDNNNIHFNIKIDDFAFYNLLNYRTEEMSLNCNDIRDFDSCKNIYDEVDTGGIYNIVFILESPHKAEFRSQIKQPFANSEKRNTFCRVVPHIIMDAVSDGILDDLSNRKVRIILANAIQYQCSLGQSITGDLGQLRNTIFSKMLSNNNHQLLCDLIGRINGYNPYAVFFSLTSETKEILSRELSRVPSYIPAINCEKKLETTHPSGWSYPEVKVFSTSD